MTTVQTDRFTAYHADTVEVARALPSDSIDYSIFSPPFASLYTYSNSPRDMGNVKDDAEFFAHYAFLIREQFRIMKPGRLVSIHCMLMPTSKERDAYIGLRDFRGDIIRAYQACQLPEMCREARADLERRHVAEFNGHIAPVQRVCEHGFIFHSEVVIWKDPVTAMQRTKALGLLHKTIRKDSAMSRQGIPDYLVTLRKPGKNPDPITHWSTDRTGKEQDRTDTNERLEVETWQRYASPVWDDLPLEDDPVELQGIECWQRFIGAATVWLGIDPNDTLQHRSAREHDDERHICPLQLPVIARAISLWTRPNDIVHTPFGGIGSEAYQALRMGRRAVLAELKSSYFAQAVQNLHAASTNAQVDLFARPSPLSPPSPADAAGHPPTMPGPLPAP